MEKGRRVQYFAAFALSLATATMGVSSAWPTPVIPKLHSNETSLNITDFCFRSPTIIFSLFKNGEKITFPTITALPLPLVTIFCGFISNDQIGTMLAMSTPGFVVGSLATRFISDMMGRRSTILASAVPFACGTFIATTAKVPWLLYIMIFLWGFGTGIVSSVATIYLAEISDKDLRGTLSVGTRFMFNFGNLIMMSIGPFLSYKVLNCTILVLPFIFFTACLWIPESPYYYLKEGKVENARKSLLQVKNTENVENELELLRQDVSKEMKNTSSAKELFTGAQYRRPIIIAAGLKLTQIMTGTVTIQQYFGRIMQEINTDMKLSTFLIIFGAVKFIVGIMSSFFVDKVGRRPLLIYSFFATGISLAIAATYFSLQEVAHVKQSSLRSFGYIPFIAIILSNVISTVGFNSIIGIIHAEIFPLNVKALAMTSLNVFGGFLGFTVAKGYQAVKNVSGLCGVFWIFSSIAIFGAIFTYFTVPETRGKSLREIQDILNFSANNRLDEENRINDNNIENEECTELKQLRKETDVKH